MRAAEAVNTASGRAGRSVHTSQKFLDILMQKRSLLSWPVRKLRPQELGAAKDHLALTMVMGFESRGCHWLKTLRFTDAWNRSVAHCLPTEPWTLHSHR